MSWEVIQGDCIERMAEMEEESVAAVVCDPPYGIDFMGKEWDSFSPARVARHAESVRRKGTEKASDRYADRFGKSQGGGVAIKYDESPSGNLRFQWWCEEWARECLRVLKPGGHLLACGGSRTHHRLVCGIEDAGFEIRDRIDTPSGGTVETPDGTLAWYFGSGFPKGKDVHKALVAMGEKQSAAWFTSAYGSPAAEAKRDQIEAAVAELERPVENAEWDGWNVALKPAHEPIVVARKPLIGTVAENVLEYGTGGINIDACRIGSGGGGDRDGEASANRRYNGNGGTNFSATPGPRGGSIDGRFPGNVVLCHLEACEQVGTKKVKVVGATAHQKHHGKGDILNPGEGKAEHPGYRDEDGTETVEAWDCAPGCPIAAMDEQSGELKSGVAVGGLHRRSPKTANCYGKFNGVQNEGDVTYGDSGGASRFFATFSADKLCDLCNLSCVESAAIHSRQSGPQPATAPAPALGGQPPESEARANGNDSDASNAGPSSRTTPRTAQTAGSSAPPDAPEQLAEWIVHLASAAGSLCEPCATSIAQSVARLLTGQTPDSPPGAGFTSEHKRQILSQNLALVAAGARSTGITPTIESLSALNGSAAPAITPSAPANDAASRIDQARFRYQAKTSRAERNAGLEGFAKKALNWSNGEESPGTFQSDGTEREQRNHHPTVKPINLMRWLARLVTPPGGRILDPFLGSGSTGCAAVLEGFEFTGIEREADYIAIAEARIAFWAQHVGREVEDVLQLHGKSTRAAKEHADRGQGDLLALAHASQGGASTQMTVDDVISDIEREGR